MKLWTGVADAVKINQYGLAFPNGLIKTNYCLLGYDLAKRQICVFPKEQEEKFCFKVQHKENQDFVACKALLRFLRLGSKLKLVKYEITEKGEMIVHYKRPYTYRKK